VNTTKTAEPIEILFGVCTRVSPKDYPLGGDLDPLGEGSIWGACPDPRGVQLLLCMMQDA